MFGLAKKFFNKKEKGADDAENGEESQKIMVATCALLMEMANIDDEFSASERANIMSIIKSDFQLSDEDAKELMATADEELKGKVDLWHFTNLINTNYSAEEKRGTIEMLWRVVYADGKLDKHEDYLIHKLAELLHISHKELIDAKLKAKNVK